MKSRTKIEDMVKFLNTCRDEAYSEGRNGDALLFEEGSSWLTWVLEVEK